MSCGKGKRARYVSCRDAQGGVADESHCAHLPRPPEFSACFSPCGQWHAGEWSPVSKTVSNRCRCFPPMVTRCNHPVDPLQRCREYPWAWMCRRNADVRQLGLKVQISSKTLQWCHFEKDKGRVEPNMSYSEFLISWNKDLLNAKAWMQFLSRQCYKFIEFMLSWFDFCSCYGHSYRLMGLMRLDIMKQYVGAINKNNTRQTWFRSWLRTWKILAKKSQKNRLNKVSHECK